MTFGMNVGIEERFQAGSAGRIKNMPLHLICILDQLQYGPQCTNTNDVIVFMEVVEREMRQPKLPDRGLCHTLGKECQATSATILKCPDFKSAPVRDKRHLWR